MSVPGTIQTLRHHVAAIAPVFLSALAFAACDAASPEAANTAGGAGGAGLDAAIADADATASEASEPDAAVDSPAAFTIFLNFEGASVTNGVDDSRVNQSSVVSETATIDAFTHANYDTVEPRDQVIRDIADGVAALFAPFDVDVVTERPASGDYVMALVGGTPADLGMPPGVAAAAPSTCDFVGRAVVFVFTDPSRPGDYASQIQWTSSAIARQVALAYGLENVTLCQDVMYSLGHCGAPRFTDFDARCSGSECRCRDSATQNSFARLAEILGLD